MKISKLITIIGFALASCTDSTKEYSLFDIDKDGDKEILLGQDGRVYSFLEESMDVHNNQLMYTEKKFDPPGFMLTPHGTYSIKLNGTTGLNDLVLMNDVDTVTLEQIPRLYQLPTSTKENPRYQIKR